MLNQEELVKEYDNLFVDESSGNNQSYYYFCHDFSIVYHIEQMRCFNLKSGSSLCQNHVKLMCKIILLLIEQGLSSDQFSQQAKTYVKYAALKIKKQKSKDMLKKIFLKNPQSLSSFSEYLKQRGIPLTFELGQISDHQNQLRQFIIQRKESCLQKALQRKIVMEQRTAHFIQYFSTFIDDLSTNQIKGKCRTLEREGQ